MLQALCLALLYGGKVKIFILHILTIVVVIRNMNIVTGADDDYDTDAAGLTVIENLLSLM